MKSLPVSKQEPYTRFGCVGTAAIVLLVILLAFQITNIATTAPWYTSVRTSTNQHTNLLGWNVTPIAISTNLQVNSSLQHSVVLEDPTSGVGNTSNHFPTDLPPPTLFQQLGGELGNNLAYLMHSFAVKWYAKEVLGLHFQVISLHQRHSKWVRARNDMHKCFRKFRDWNFERDQSWVEFQERKQQQEVWITNERLKVLEHVNDAPEKGTAFNNSLKAYLEEYARPDKPQQAVGRKYEISLPFLSINSMIPNYFFDHYYDRIRELLVFEKSPESGCCAILPEEDESVFHFRNFGTELPRGRNGLVDFGPNQTARDLFAHLKPGEKVVIITRFNNRKLEAQVDALRRKGLQVRVVTGQTGVQDFCVLLQAKKEVIGNAKSSYAFWGSLLGSAKKVKLSFPVSIRTLVAYDGSLERMSREVLYNYTHTDITRRLEISLIPLDE